MFIYNMSLHGFTTQSVKYTAVLDIYVYMYMSIKKQSKLIFYQNYIFC